MKKWWLLVLLVFVPSLLLFLYFQKQRSLNADVDLNWSFNPVSECWEKTRQLPQINLEDLAKNPVPG
jgi:hypothetical protein